MPRVKGTRNISVNKYAASLKKREIFLKAFAETGLVGQSAKVAGVERETVNYWRQASAEFLSEFEEARKLAIERLEREALRRAVEGVDEPVYYQGVQVGKMRRYSDTLLIFILKGNAPEKYRERFDINQSGKIDHEHQHHVTIDVKKLNDDDLRVLEGMLSKATVDETADGKAIDGTKH